MERRVTRAALWLLIVTLAVLLGACGLSNQGATERTTLPLDDATVQFVRPFVVGMMDGVRQWDIEAERMREKDGVIYLDMINPGQLYRDGERYLSFTATTGVWIQTRDRLELVGDVRVFRDGDPLLTTERLIWEGRDETLNAPGPVEITHDGYIIRANEMVGNVPDDELIFTGDVEVLSKGMRLEIPGQLVYHVADGKMHGLGEGILRLDMQ